MQINEISNSRECKQFVQPVKDTLDVVSGKWKLPIMMALSLDKKRFKELERMIAGISPRMLSKELRELETNELISRTVYDTVPVTVIYALTPYGKSLDTVIAAMRAWGLKHRSRVMAKTE